MVKNVILWDILVNMFKGITNIRLDTKGRLTIPTKYRSIIDEQSNSKMVITIAVSYTHLTLPTTPYV